MRNGIVCCGMALLALAATPSIAAAPITQAAATRIADATVAAWMSMSAAKIEALYAPGVTGFDMIIAPLVTDRATWAP